MYTLDTILADCVGRYIATQGRVQLNNLINSRTYAECWGAFLSWVVRQYQSGFSVSLAPLGVIVYSKHGGKTRGAFRNIDVHHRSVCKLNLATSRTPISTYQLTDGGDASDVSFAFLTPFVERYELQPKQCACIFEADLPCTKMNVSTLAKVRANFLVFTQAIVYLASSRNRK